MCFKDYSYVFFLMIRLTPRSTRKDTRVPDTTLFRSFLLTVVDVVDETADARSISFEVPEGAEEKFAYRPGQFLTLAVPSDQTVVAARCYSLSSSPHDRSEEHTSELQSLMRISYAVFCLKKKTQPTHLPELQHTS